MLCVFGAWKCLPLRDWCVVVVWCCLCVCVICVSCGFVSHLFMLFIYCVCRGGPMDVCCFVFELCVVVCCI